MAFGTFLYFKHRLFPSVVLGLLSLALSCSKSTNPDTNKPPDQGSIGVLLSGTDGDAALSGTSNHGPFAVPAEEWAGDFVTTRLEGVFNPSATVGEVNGALNAVSAKISCMRAGMMFVELVIVPQSNVTTAAETCTTLVTSGAFLSVYPCHRSKTALFPPTPANGIVSHFERARVPAAWNVRERVASLNNAVTVLVADDFRELTSHAEIPAQTFLAGSGTVDLTVNSDGEAEGNHGFFVASLIGARFDDIGTTGLFADPGGILRIPCLATDGLGSWIAVLADLSDHLPATGQFILNTSFGYIPDFALVPKRERAEHAFFWRLLVAGRQNRFLHTQASGNEGNASPSLQNADNGSPFALASRFNTPLEMLQGTPVSPQDTADLTLLLQSAINTNPLFGTRLSNVLVVGSSDHDGDLSLFSNVPADVRMIGQTLFVPCLFDDSRCDPGTNVPLQAMVAGTSFAAPQVAALAAWLWALQPALTVEQTIGTLRNCYDGRWIDAYEAVLSLDNSLASANIRRTILDVANGSGQIGSNGAFDEIDLRVFVDSIAAYESGRVSEVPPFSMDHSIFDLNGDGYTGDTSGVPSKAPFDLDVNVPPAYGTVSVIPCTDPSAFDTTYDEHAVSDRDILRYYAYSSLYQGDESTRDGLLGGSCDPFWVGPDSGMYRTFIQCFPLNIQEDDTNFAGFASVNIDETRDSLTAFCKDAASTGYRFQLAMNGNASLSASAGPSSVSVNGGASLHSTATATAPPQPSPCRFGIAGFLSSVNTVRFAMGGDKFSIPLTLAVSGSVTPTGANGSSVALARCIVQLFVIDTTVSARVAGAREPHAPAFLTFDSDVNPLPFQMNSLLTQLPEHSVYQMEIIAQAYSFVTTQVDPGTGQADIDVSVSLFAGE